jgi:hypothetical protein
MPSTAETLRKLRPTGGVTLVSALAMRIGVVVVVLGAGASARAGDLRKAKELYQKAEEAFAASRYAEAADLFDRSFQESNRPQLLWNVAYAHRRQFEIDRDPSRLRRAREVYLNYSELIQSASEREEARNAIDEIDQQLKALEAAQKAAKSEAPNEPGVPLAPSSQAAPAARAGDSAAAHAGASRPSRAWVVAGGALVGLGMALGGAALGTGLTAKHNYESLASSCGASADQCPNGYQSTRDTGRSLDAATWAMVGVGGVALIAGAALLIVGVRKGRSKETASVSPVIIPGGGALVIGGRL